MRVLVIDTIHGGLDIARSLAAKGHFTDMVDVYRGRHGIDPDVAASREYDLAVAPVHLDPSHPLLRSLSIPVISHHEAVRWILGKDRPSPFVEVTGARGKTTTAWALAHLMDGPGVLHTSMGTFRFPGRELMGRRSITPASILPAAGEAWALGGWLIAEVSLGCTGAGDIGILTSAGDYPVAGGKRHALAEKVRSAQGMPCLIVPPGIGSPGAIQVEEVVSVEGETCICSGPGRAGRFSSPLLSVAGYRDPLMLAAVAGSALGGDLARLASFSALEGRMSESREGEVLIIDNSNSGTNASTTREAAGYARRLAGTDELTLVVGKEAGAVCEGFPSGEIGLLAGEIRPARAVVVGDEYTGIERHPGFAGIPVAHARTLEEGTAMARSLAGRGSIVLSVKCWR